MTYDPVYKNDPPESIVSHPNTEKPWIWSSSSATNWNAYGIFYDGHKENHWASLNNRYWFERPVLYHDNQ